MSEALKAERESFEAWWRTTRLGERNEAWQGWRTRAVSQWARASDRLPTEPGWYLVMLAPDNDWGLMSDTPLQVEFDAYKSKPQAFTCVYDWKSDEDITEAVTHWMPLPAAPKVPA